MAGGTIPGGAIPQEPITSSQSSKPPGTTNYTESPRNAREEAKERRKKAAAKALAEQARLREKQSRQLTSSMNKTTKVPEDGQESRNISPAQLPHTSHSGFATPPVNSSGTHTILSSKSQLDISPTAFQDDKFSDRGTNANNNTSQPLHTNPFTGKTEPAAATQQATSASPKKLSPSNWAKRDARFEVQFLVTKGETIQSEAPGYMSKQIFLEWDGTGLEALKIVNGGKECLLVEFSTIQRVSYNPTGQHLQLIFSTTTQEGLQTVVIAMNSLPCGEWVDLQQLFRQVERKWRIRCDQEDMSFFDAAIKSMRKKAYEKMEIPYLNRSDAITQKVAGRLPKAPRRQSVPTASRRQSVGPKLSTTSKIAKTPKNKVERPKGHLSAEVKNIMAAKVIGQPLQIPHLTTPSRPPSVTSSLMSRISQSPLKEETASQRSVSRGYGDRDSPTKRSVKPQNRSQVPRSSTTIEGADSPHGLSNLFGSDDSEHDFPGFGQPDRTPSQRFTDQMNEAKMISSKNSLLLTLIYLQLTSICRQPA